MTGCSNDYALIYLRSLADCLQFTTRPSKPRFNRWCRLNHVISILARAKKYRHGKSLAPNQNPWLAFPQRPCDVNDDRLPRRQIQQTGLTSRVCQDGCKYIFHHCHCCNPDLTGRWTRSLFECISSYSSANISCANFNVR